MVAELVISSTLVPQKSLFTASSFCRPFFFGKERATAERKTGKGEGALGRCANVTKGDNNKQTPKVAYLFRSVRLLARNLLPPSRSPNLTRFSLSRASLPWSRTARTAPCVRRFVMLMRSFYRSTSYLHHAPRRDVLMNREK